MATVFMDLSIAGTSQLARPLQFTFLILCYVILQVACAGSSLSTPTAVPTATELPREDSLVATGEALARSTMPTSCVVCHADDESTRIGTGWEGYYGSQVMLVDGTVVTVDDEYIRESIVDPNAKVVEGFSPDVMPQSYGDVLSDGDIEAIIAYIKSFQ